MGLSDHLFTCLLRNLYARQEATVRTGYGTTDWFQIGKGVRQACILLPCLFNFYAEYIMRNARLDEAQAGINFTKRTINNLRYADDTTLMAESEEELKSLLINVKEESEKVGLRLNIQKTRIMASGPIISWQIDGAIMETVRDFIFLDCFPIYLLCSDGTRCYGLIFLNVVLSQLFHSPLSLSSRDSLILLHFLP